MPQFARFSKGEETPPTQVRQGDDARFSDRRSPHIVERMTSVNEFDVAIVGGGAAGLAAAIFAGEAGPARIAVIDSAQKLGAKIMVSGGGRCNVTHHEVAQRDFNGSKNIVRNILAAFDVPATIRWFEALGVPLKQEPTGKLFPVTNTARSVVDALLNRCRQLNVMLLTDRRVMHVDAPGGERPTFSIAHTAGEYRAKRVIVCTGGQSLPRTGSDGSGWEILRQLGHTVTPTYAALVPLVLAPQMFHAALAGISMQVGLSIFIANKRVDHRTGSLLWTHFGISGPVVMDASRHWTRAHETGLSPRMECNLLPGESFEVVEKRLIDAAMSRPTVGLLNLLGERLPRRVMAEILQRIGIDSGTPAGQLSRDARRTLVHELTALVLPIVQHLGWNYAEVTAGGVPLEEIDYRTMQSRRVPGLFLAGETLDCDGRIGGFNFQWAWATGLLAGRAAVPSLAEIDR